VILLTDDRAGALHESDGVRRQPPECPTPPYERNTQQSPFRGRVIAHESLDATHTDAELSGAGPKERRPAVIVGYCRHILGRAGQAAHL
jgi:hypothetical protein